eukprot:9432160-Pyramimonas_sp.AAC.1
MALFGSALDTDTAEVTVKTLLSHLVTREFNSLTNSLRTPYVRVEPYIANGGGGKGLWGVECTLAVIGTGGP